jgi:hypothetical protein
MARLLLLLSDEVRRMAGEIGSPHLEPTEESRRQAKSRLSVIRVPSAANAFV